MRLSLRFYSLWFWLRYWRKTGMDLNEAALEALDLTPDLATVHRPKQAAVNTGSQQSAMLPRAGDKSTGGE